ncbi:hypothetical protein SAMN05192563_1024157 [Paraburkholderia aspalathi]|uniref:Uncharacterized protein n=1 Tax=Paraburkholderia aspalathi TaxID=1324617 RepID=A0A1I7EJK1_9BURK|nr:hypothetical protein SAMN05192563_1024157 [Paraburkholderia aspalathi]
MKRWIRWRVVAAALAACGICASARAGGYSSLRPQRVGSGSCQNVNGSEPVGTWRVTPANAVAACYRADIPVTVVGAYGHTTLDMLLSGPFILVRWPKGCCPENGRWHTGDTSQSHTGENQHVIFLWPVL